jgi:iron complex transport system ATP-binding protein
VIAFENVVVRYPRSNASALAGVSLKAADGKLTAVVGPNGSGKSTLVRALIGRVPLLSGAVRVDSLDAGSLERDDLARRVAVVTQREDLAFPMSVIDYVRLGRFPHLGVWQSPRAQDREIVDDAIDAAGIADLRERMVDEISGGEWQRVRLARALAQGAAALVLDEPTTFLDIAHEMAVFQLLDRLVRGGMAVLLVSHQLNLVARFADHIVLLHRGSVAVSGAPNDVMRADVLEEVYEWPLVVSRDPAVGAPTLVPLRSR